MENYSTGESAIADMRAQKGYHEHMKNRGIDRSKLNAIAEQYSIARDCAIKHGMDLTGLGLPKVLK